MKELRKPKRLRQGDRVAVVSLSWGGLGDESLLHKYHIAKERLERDFGLEVVPMPHALKGSRFVWEHPELRAKDFMDAFADDSIAAVFCAIGGEDAIRLLPYVDYDVIGRHPKIFMGYSDSTVNHLMLYRAGIVSFYGPSVMAEFGEYGAMMDYTKQAVLDILFGETAGHPIRSSDWWSDDFIPWEEGNLHRAKKMRAEQHGYEILQGRGRVQGHLLGGCADVLFMCLGTEIWPAADQWQGALLFLETSEDKPAPALSGYLLRNLAAQGILKALSGIIVAKPMDEAYYEEYKQVLLRVVAEEEGLGHLPILYNANIGHAPPIGVLPYGIRAELDCAQRALILLESATLP